MGDNRIKCGVKFCGGCNPRYERGLALKELKTRFQDRAEFSIAAENEPADLLLVIGGCTNCCASHEQYPAARLLKMWDEDQKEQIAGAIGETIEKSLGKAVENN